MIPPVIGTIGLTRARLFDDTGKLIGYCLDTPNAIAKALMECSRIQTVQSILRTTKRDYYNSRMQDWNIARSDLEMI